MSSWLALRCVWWLRLWNRLDPVAEWRCIALKARSGLTGLLGTGLDTPYSTTIRDELCKIDTPHSTCEMRGKMVRRTRMIVLSPRSVRDRCGKLVDPHGLVWVLKRILNDVVCKCNVDITEEASGCASHGIGLFRSHCDDKLHPSRTWPHKCGYTCRFNESKAAC